MSWGREVIIDEETFAGPSDEQFAKFDGSFHRLLDLNTVGSWATLWIAGLYSLEIPRQDMYGVTTNVTIPGTPHIMLGIYSSAGSRPVGPVTEFGRPVGSQWMGGYSSASGASSMYQSGGAYYYNFPWWSAYERGDGTGATISGGQQIYTPVAKAPSVRRAFWVFILKDTVWKFSSGLSSGITAVDITKQEIVDWLLDYSTTISWQINRPANTLYGGSGASAVDMVPGTYGALDTIFFECNIPGVTLKIHGIWGRTFSTVV